MFSLSVFVLCSFDKCKYAFLTLSYENATLDANQQVRVPYYNSFIYCYHFKLLFLISYSYISCNAFKWRSDTLPVSG